MSDLAREPDAIDEVIDRLWTPRTLDELMQGFPVYTSWDQLDIPDLTDGD